MCSAVPLLLCFLIQVTTGERSCLIASVLPTTSESRRTNGLIFHLVVLVVVVVFLNTTVA